MVERIVDTFNRVLPRNLDEGIFVLGPDFGEEIRDELREICERHDMEAHFTVQETAEGTAHAVGCAGDHLSGEGIVVFADTVFDMEAGVQCESCHGAGSEYMLEAVMRDPVSAAAAGLQAVEQETCLGCHAPDEAHGKAFDVETAWDEVDHSRWAAAEEATERARAVVRAGVMRSSP